MGAPCPSRTAHLRTAGTQRLRQAHHDRDPDGRAPAHRRQCGGAGRGPDDRPDRGASRRRYPPRAGGAGEFPDTPGVSGIRCVRRQPSRASAGPPPCSRPPSGRPPSHSERSGLHPAASPSASSCSPVAGYTVGLTASPTERTPVRFAAVRQLRGRPRRRGGPDTGGALAAGRYPPRRARGAGRDRAWCRPGRPRPGSTEWAARGPEAPRPRVSSPRSLRGDDAVDGTGRAAHLAPCGRAEEEFALRVLGDSE